jgi:AcrR family transcriptional regulator
MYNKGTATRAHIINTANNLFYHQGFNQTSFTDIAQSAGIPKGNFYHYFKTKEEILEDVIQQRIKNIENQLHNIEELNLQPTDRIRFFISSLKNNKNGFAQYGCPIGSIITELGKTQLALKTKSKKILELIHNWLNSQFQQSGKHKATADTLSRHIMVRIQGAIIIAHAYEDKSCFTEEIDQLLEWMDKEASSAV